MTNKTTLIAQALADNRNYKNARINANILGSVSEARKWQSAVKTLRLQAYNIYKHNHDAMSNATNVKPINLNKFYDDIRKVLELIGDVNGFKLNANNCAQAIIAVSAKIKTIDITPEMAHAHNEKSLAKKALKNAMTDEEIKEAETNLDKWTEEVETLESEPGNCKKIFDVQSETAFIKSVEILLGDAITKQSMRTVEDIQAEIDAKKAERKAKKNNK